MISYFELGALLVSRLRNAEIAQVVDQIAALDVLDSKYLPSKGIYVSMTGDEVGTTTGEGIATQIIQVWTVTVALFNARHLDLSMGPQHEMGATILQVHDLIAGWNPDTTQYGPFIRRGGPGPQYLEDHWIYPLTFEIQAPLFSDSS